MVRAMIRALAVLAGVVVLATPASAQEAERDDLVVLTGHLLVASDDEVDAAVIFDGPAVVEGTVRESLVVMNGSTEVSGTVDGDVVVLNGDVVLRSTAVVGGDVLSQAAPEVEDGATVRGEFRQVATSLDVERLGIVGRIAWWVAYSVSSLVLGVVALWFAPRLGIGLRRVVRVRTVATIGWGIALFFLIPIGSVLLMVTLVGLPLGLFGLLAFALITTLGYAIGAMGVGSLILRDRGRYATFAAGLVVLRLLALIPVLGGLLWLAASIWGLGLLAIGIREGSVREPDVPAPPPFPPAPAVA